MHTLRDELQNHTLVVDENYRVMWDGVTIGQLSRDTKNLRSHAICMAINEELDYLRMNLAPFAQNWEIQTGIESSQMLVWSLNVPFEQRVQTNVENGARLRYTVHTRLYHQDPQVPAIGAVGLDWWKGIQVTLKNPRPAFEPAEVTLDPDVLTAFWAEGILSDLMPFEVTEVESPNLPIEYKIVYQPQRLQGFC